MLGERGEEKGLFSSKGPGARGLSHVERTDAQMPAVQGHNGMTEPDCGFEPGFTTCQGK